MEQIKHLEVGKIRVVYGTHLHLCTCVDYNLAYLYETLKSIFLYCKLCIIQSMADDWPMNIILISINS